MAEGGGFLRDSGCPGFSGGSHGGPSSGRKRKGGSYSTRELDALVASARAEPAAQPGSASSIPAETQQALRALDDGIDDAAYEAMLEQLPSDTMASLQMLRTQVNDRTTVDRAIDAEARAGRVRRFKLSTGPDDYAVMLAADYAQELDRACAQAGASSAGDDAVAGSSKAAAAAMEIAEAERVLRARSTGERPSASAASGLFSASDGEDERRQPVGATTVPGGGDGGVQGTAGGEGRGASAIFTQGANGPSPFVLFRERVLPRAHGLSISQAELTALLSVSSPHQETGVGAPASGPAGISGGAAVPRRAGSVEEAAMLKPCGAVSALLTAGFLTRGLQQEGASLWFAFPNAGVLAKAIQSGRQVLTSAIQKQPLKQIRQRDVEKLKIRGSPFPAVFHIRDMIGSHLLSSVTTTTGPLLRLGDRSESARDLRAGVS